MVPVTPRSEAAAVDAGLSGIVSREHAMPSKRCRCIRRLVCVVAMSPLQQDATESDIDRESHELMRHAMTLVISNQGWIPGCMIGEIALGRRHAIVRYRSSLPL